MSIVVARHRTAMVRNALSRPLAAAIADHVLSQSSSVFDYGCGRGDDLRNLSALGYAVDGWDPNHRPHTERRHADVVNLGYVVNVIERPDERAETLRTAWGLTKKVLIVSSRLTWDARELVGRPLGDGLLTRTGTFQKFYQQAELATWIEETLGVQAHAAAPGIFYIFREPSAAQQFLASRVYRYRPRVRTDPHAVYETHRDTLAPLFDFLSDHARPPRPGELSEGAAAAITEAVGGLGRATSLIRKVTDDNYWEQVTLQRRSELLIYIALSRFGRRPRFSQLGSTLAGDIRTLFGTYQSACVQADRMLLACGDPTMVLVSARSSAIGKQTPTALYVHRSALAELPPVLQVYEGCARVLSGTVEHANLIKLSVGQPQVSYLVYPRFDRDAHPTLAASITVNLKSLSVERRDYSRSDNPPLIHRKEEFVGREDPRRELYAKLTRAEQRAGLYQHPERIGSLRGWEATLAAAGVRVGGHRLFRLKNDGTPN
ncbi:DNA phosphorothioation-associated putative methyltransferase [Nocardia abscessus]|uniref:DNA phosphorothioation-associated putative methyltransferase n=1 Tax=Nocardia abscessus TaxID=120957 RepID=UPI0024556F4B|nr:DNA phosphorothioation-associated putative methyltransferase [Nocardia abscessus]